MNFMPWIAVMLMSLLMTELTVAQRNDPVEPPTLTRAVDVARYDFTEKTVEPRVILKAIVTFVDPTGTVFLQDETGATFLRGSSFGKTLHPGQKLSVDGMYYPGLFIGGIVPHKVEIMGEAGLPTPQVITRDDLQSGKFHYQLIEMEGVGRAVEVVGETAVILRVNVPGGVIDVRFDQTPEDASKMVDARLRIQGLAAGAINDRHQLVRPYVKVADTQAITILEEAPVDPFGMKVQPLSALLDFTTSKSTLHRMMVRGVALSGVINGGLFIRGQERSLYVQTPVSMPVNPGDVVEALGFPEMGVFSAYLADATYRVTGQEPVPLPLEVTSKDLSNGVCDSDLITLDASILQSLENESALLVQSEKRNIKVMLPPGAPTAYDIGVTARFTGICRVTATKHEGYRASPTAYELWLRTPEDMAVLSSAPWWNMKRLSLVLGAVATAALLAFAWAVMLRKQVNNQLHLLQAKAQTEAVLEERQRIAREFHDTLEQELAGLTIRLDAATTRVTDVKARELLEQQRHLLSRLQTESRDFVWDLRDSTRHETPLEKALQALLAHLQATTPITLQLDCPEALPEIPPLAQHHLLCITREATNNAIKYARATTIKVTAQSSPDLLRVLIEDDGQGFDVATKDRQIGHFGLQGMKERARKIQADLQIQSKAGQGTRVELSLALPVMPV